MTCHPPQQHAAAVPDFNISGIACGSGGELGQRFHRLSRGMKQYAMQQKSLGNGGITGKSRFHRLQRFANAALLVSQEGKQISHFRIGRTALLLSISRQSRPASSSLPCR